MHGERIKWSISLFFFTQSNLDIIIIQPYAYFIQSNSKKRGKKSNPDISIASIREITSWTSLEIKMIHDEKCMQMLDAEQILIGFYTLPFEFVCWFFSFRFVSFCWNNV